MPLRITTKKLIPWHHDFPDEIKVQMLNEVVDDYATEVVNALGDLYCPKHPGEISYIIIIADRVQSMIIEKKFCCPQFEEKVSLKLKR
jgi:hypothetical protein